MTATYVFMILGGLGLLAASRQTDPVRKKSVSYFGAICFGAALVFTLL